MQSKRDLLIEIQKFCANNNCKSLIPNESSYKQQLKAYEYQTHMADINKNHGLRHAYAQNRYLELTGRECPKNGGLKSSELTPQQKIEDHNARMQISNELGHGREQITAVYLGR